MTPSRRYLPWLLCLAAGSVFAQAAETPAAPAAATSLTGGGSIAFCLFELPASAERQQWVNLGIIQYIELRPDELRIYYGGGNFGNGHEARFPLKHRHDGAAIVKKMLQAAQACR